APSGHMIQFSLMTHHGFTSHEMLDNLNLVHMNGRVYDPIIGRFLSADPFIDGAGSTQGWNRYAYVHNNPLSYTDPSGFDANEHPSIRPNDPIKLSPAGFASWLAAGVGGLTAGPPSPAPRVDLWSIRRGWGATGTDWPTDSPATPPSPS